MMIASGAIACRLRAVSASVSPLVTEEAEAEMLIVSADNRLPAISKDVRVRVEGSKKKLMTVFHRRVGTFFIVRVLISLNDCAVSRMVVISSTESCRIPNRSFRLKDKVGHLSFVIGHLSLVIRRLSSTND